MRTIPPRSRYALNLSTVLRPWPVPDRPVAAARAGFDLVETWWPFAVPVPDRSEKDRFLHGVEEAGTALVALNFDAGDFDAGDRGILADPRQQERFRANVAAAVALADATGCRLLNAPYGNRLPDTDPEIQHGVALANLAHAAREAETIGATVLVEPLNPLDNPAYLLASVESAVDTITDARAASGTTNIALLLDVYHLHRMGADPPAAIRRYHDLISHVQFADAPGRTCPGTGEIDFTGPRGALAKIGYAGVIGLEFFPTPSLDADLRTLREFTGIDDPGAYPGQQGDYASEIST